MEKMDGADEPVLDVSHLTKSFGTKTILDDLSFHIESGEIFGLLGPNGAGKTTMIRIILDIIKSDYGSVTMFGKVFTEAFKERIGYLPEERGLYQKITVFECLKYFANLKNVKKPDDRIDFWLEKVDLIDHKKMRVSELSKGMQQKIQLASAFIHDPDILILDEPFSGLDPINTKIVKDIMLDLKRDGKTVILSTHQMDQAERMCDRILMINHGKKVLYGTLDQIKSDYRESPVMVVEYEGDLKPIDGVKGIEDYGRYAELDLRTGTDPQDVLRNLMESVKLRRFEMKSPSLNEIFIEVANVA
ncbi:MAG: ATP-binding cassette domain-containing protein [Euryarchaeota archaeon]|nr:MAG: Trehalose/maltose import ATP-binding protein MalK [ANME-2 cluster archaeon]MEA1864107.1 ATP-binding cassette domain-containing protein [Euryarchaeota archaeon]